MTKHRVELTTQEVAYLLNISQPFLESLLDGGELPHHKMGAHGRVRLGDFQTYKRRRDAEREAALKELTVLSDEEGYWQKWGEGVLRGLENVESL